MQSPKLRLLKQLPKLKGVRVVVLGDLMLDEHIWCDVSRISPEAPVPVARVKHITHVPGGAANVAKNIADLGGLPYLFGTVGLDDSGNKLINILQSARVLTDGVVRTLSRPTILKSRVIAQHQHVVRVDREDTSPIQPKTHHKIMTVLAGVIAKAGAVLISDYHKGFLTDALVRDVIRLARRHRVPVLVDPKGVKWTKYKKATVLTPNRAEAEAAAKSPIQSDASLWKAARLLLRRYDLQAVLITRSEQGMTLFPRGAAPRHVSAITQEVYDITGAGDTVIATLALALAAGIKLLDAVMLANVAASVVVGKVGTATTNPGELSEQLRKLKKRQLDAQAW
jgi:D-beta-D-heptose 7-phosphate kinase/D-beta-D-heptose 1-phosphate adenosyltransferase